MNFIKIEFLLKKKKKWIYEFVVIVKNFNVFLMNYLN